jgi:uncharacterized membrane protein (UPF0127 family)
LDKSKPPEPIPTNGANKTPRFHILMKNIQLKNTTRPLPSSLIVFFCDNFLCRLRGLMFRSSLAADKGLLLVESRDTRLDTAIHMLFVFMDLAVIWINSEQEVVDTILARSWHPVYVPRQPARYTLEICPERLNEFKIGDVIEFQNA